MVRSSEKPSCAAATGKGYSAVNTVRRHRATRAKGGFLKSSARDGTKTSHAPGITKLYISAALPSVANQCKLIKVLNQNRLIRILTIFTAMIADRRPFEEPDIRSQMTASSSDARGANSVRTAIQNTSFSRNPCAAGPSYEASPMAWFPREERHANEHRRNAKSRHACDPQRWGGKELHFRKPDHRMDALREMTTRTASDRAHSL